MNVRPAWGLAVFLAIAGSAAAQSTHGDWLAQRTVKQARHHQLPGPATRADAFTITAIRFFSDPAGNLVGVGEARNDTAVDLSYSRINFAFFDAGGAELSREWTYLLGGVNARIVANGAYETLLVPGATGFFKIWTTLPARRMSSYTARSAGEHLAYAKPEASLGLADSRPERWSPLVYVTGHGQAIVDQRLFGGVLNEDPFGPGCVGCENQNVFTTSLQVSLAAYKDGVIADVQSMAVAGRTPAARCTGPLVTGISLRDGATFTAEFAQPADSIGHHAVEWVEGERPSLVSPTSFLFDFVGEASFTIDPWCGGAPVESSPWIRVVNAGPSGRTAGRVTFAVATNPDTSTRYGTLTVRGAQVQVTQNGACPIYPSETIFLGAGRVTDLRTVDIPRPTCLPENQISSSVHWLRAEGAGGGLKLRVWAEPNLTAATRTGVVRLGQRTLTVHQAPGNRSLDFDSDGRLDLLWHHRRDGWIAGWRMDGLKMRDGTLLSWNRVPDTAWAPAAVADLDANSAPDVIWQNHVTRALSLWRLSGTNVVKGDSSFASASSTDWKLRSSADFDRDGVPDFVWQHETTGQLEIWYMQSGKPPEPAFPAFSGEPPVRLGTAPLGTGAVADLHWKIVGSGDFNRDGSPDLVWQHQTDGAIAVWKMTGATLLEASMISPDRVADLNWKIRAVGDANGDDMPDLIWQHRGDGRVAVWLMNGTTRTTGVVIAQLADLNWEIVGPR